MSKLEPEIIKYLQKNSKTHINDLVNHFSNSLKLPENKVNFRIKKLISQNKLSFDTGLISIPDKDENHKIEEFDEVFEHGPFKIERKGRMNFIKSNWSEDEHKKHIKFAKDNLPRLKETVNQKIKNIEKNIIEKFDPLDVLAYSSYKNLTCDPEVYTESSFEGKQLYPEIIQNVILKNKFEVYREKTNRDDIPEIEKKLEELFSDLVWLTTYEIITNDQLTDVEKQILSKVFSRLLAVRGDAYPTHYKLIASELFGCINNKLKEKGFVIEQYFETLEEIERQINYNFNEPINKFKEEHQKFIDFCKTEREKGEKDDVILQKYQEDLDKRRERHQPDIDKLSEIALKGNFQIEINKKINQNLLKYLSLEFGNNESWNHPFDKSEINIKPIIKAKDKYYCFIASNLIRNVISIIEGILTNNDKNEVKYDKKKGEYFENKVVKLFKEKLKKAQVYTKLHYGIKEDGQDKWPEIDCVIVYKDNLILIEIKGKTKRRIEGRKDVLTIIEGDLKKNISDAFEQTKRAYQYISENKKCQFEKERGKSLLEIEKEKFKNIFLINVTSESFVSFSTDLNLLKLFRNKLLDSMVYPYAINIYDLLVLTDLIEEEDFIDFLKQRIDISKNYEIKSEDELDFLGYYLAHGSLNKTEDMEKIQSPLIHGYSEEIDTWYLYLEGCIKSAKKPTKNKN